MLVDGYLTHMILSPRNEVRGLVLGKIKRNKVQVCFFVC